ncbi:MAG TPA: lactate racemase domain-containing protein [Candidatus Anammoximicrobium sp.]|mgnify:CR=1 FL=1|nr:lactate racemase domain-containing protein [Candidatus Anammoximicrobium sp.]
MISLRYGDGHVLRIEPPLDAVVDDLDVPRGKPLDDPAAGVAAALADPLDYPPLQKATTPGDRVVLAIDRGVPQLDAVVAGAVHALLDSRVLPEDITLLMAPEENGIRRPKPTNALATEIAAAIRIAEHDPQNHADLTYLAASKENRPIYIHRQLFDADLVLPISCLRPRRVLGRLGVHGGLFPTFSDAKTRERFQSPAAARSPVQRHRRRDEVEEAAWLLGVQIVLQVVPGAGGAVLHVLAGKPEAVAKRGRQLCDAAWLCRLPRRASLVLASIAGGRHEQSWENFARALSAALAAVADDGVIVLCTDLRCPPGPALQLLSLLNDAPETLREIRRARTSDAVSASLLVEARERTQVYLLSGLDGETVEDMGLGYISNEDEIGHLCQQFDSCLLLADAHRAGVAVDEDL